MKAQVTKKQIREAINTMNVANLHKFAHLLGENVYHLIESSNASYKARTNAEYAVWDSTHERQRLIADCRRKSDNDAAILMERKHKILEYLKEMISREHDSYTKVAMLGHTQLYFCSPAYGHKDYNKWSTGLKIEGNEKFINKVIAISNRAFGCNFAMA